MFFEEVFRSLNRRRVDYVVVGGLASVLHGMVRMTADIDLMIDLSERNITRFLSAMKDLDYKPRLPVKAEDLISPVIREMWRDDRNMTVFFSFYNPDQPIALLDVFIHNPIKYEKARLHATRMKSGRITIPVVSIDDLIRLKKLSGRDQDIEDIKALRILKKREKK